MVDHQTLYRCEQILVDALLSPDEGVRTVASSALLQYASKRPPKPRPNRDELRADVGAIADLLHPTGEPVVAAAILAELLVERRPGVYGGNSPAGILTARSLGHALGLFGIRTKQMRLNGRVVRVYHVADLLLGERTDVEIKKIVTSTEEDVPMSQDWDRAVAIATVRAARKAGAMVDEDRLLRALCDQDLAAVRSAISKPEPGADAAQSTSTPACFANVSEPWDHAEAIAIRRRARDAGVKVDGVAFGDAVEAQDLAGVRAACNTGVALLPVAEPTEVPVFTPRPVTKPKPDGMDQVEKTELDELIARTQVKHKACVLANDGKDGRAKLPEGWDAEGDGSAYAHRR